MKSKRDMLVDVRGSGRAPAGAKADKGTETLKRLAKKLGNAQVQSVLGKNNEKRDQIYQFIVQRLQRIKAVQAKEKAAMGQERVWFDEVARKKPGFSLPDPTRWRAAAQHYRKAAQALARGNLGQAVAHLDRAMKAEQVAFANMPTQVTVDSRVNEIAEDAPAASTSAEGCNPREVTEAVNLAEHIERVAEKSDETALHRQHRRRGWWETDEEAEEKADKKEGAKATEVAAKQTGASEPRAAETELPEEEEALDVQKDEGVKHDVEQGEAAATATITPSARAKAPRRTSNRG